MSCKWAERLFPFTVYCRKFRTRVPIEYCGECDHYEED